MLETRVIRITGAAGGSGRVAATPRSATMNRAWPMDLDDSRA